MDARAKAGGVYSELLANWCHEGFQISPNPGGTWSGSICSHTVIGYTPNECAEQMAAHIMAIVAVDPECGGC